ncbi:MAG: cytochrome C oxidase subunit IV family protein [Anaerolineales bacterium]|nr:cytochrome C oxidase subunit IV family protein [Anaerolineales bacterium]
MDKNKKQSYKLGLTVLIILAVLTGIEFLIASVNVPWTRILYLITILKAWFVIQNYMHLPRLFKEEEGH